MSEPGQSFIAPLETRLKHETARNPSMRETCGKTELEIAERRVAPRLPKRQDGQSFEKMSDKLQFVAAQRQAKGNSDQVVELFAEPAKRGDSIKPGVERSGTPGSLKERKRAHEVGDSDSNITKS